MILSSAMVKICKKEDCISQKFAKCLLNQGFQFQILVDTAVDIEEKICIESSLENYIQAYRVYDVKGGYEHRRNKKTDDYYIKPVDDMYPDLLKKADKIKAKQGEKVVLLIDVSAQEKPVGVHTIEIKIGKQSTIFTLQVMNASLVPTDLIVTHWMHIDCICDYYNVLPFGNEFYKIFDTFLTAYVEMGNTMILLPAFTAPLDTAVGHERTTTQLVGVTKCGETYDFDFTKMKEYLNFCIAHGVKYFEHSHLFTQWGAEFCPKIIVKENEKEYNAFGWAVRSDDLRYQNFLREYLKALTEFLEEEHLSDKLFLHITDEPKPEDIERYKSLSTLVKENARGLKTMDALSEYSFAKEKAVDMPIVVMNSKELSLFDENKMLYYCVEVDNEYITNHLLNMPLQRTEILGMQLYETQAKGFLSWAYNFYSAEFSLSRIDPYNDATSGGGFPAGDPFIVYPGKDGVEPSVRFFSLKRAFEDYRLLKSVEEKIGKEQTLELLHENGVRGVHEYPRSVVWHEGFREKLVDIIVS